MLLTGTGETGAQIDGWGRRQRAGGFARLKYWRLMCSWKYMLSKRWAKGLHMWPVIYHFSRSFSPSRILSSLYCYIILLQVTAMNLCHLMYYFYFFCAWNDFRIFKLRMQGAVFHSKHGKIFVEPKLSQSTKQRGTRQRITKRIYVFLIPSAFAVAASPMLVSLLQLTSGFFSKEQTQSVSLSLSNIGAVRVRLRHLDNAKGNRHPPACIQFEGS